MIWVQSYLGTAWPVYKPMLRRGFSLTSDRSLEPVLREFRRDGRELQNCFFRPQSPTNIENRAKANSQQNAPLRRSCSGGHFCCLLRGYHQRGNGQIRGAALERGCCKDW